MASATSDIEHPARTQRSHFRYLFTAKHHGGDKRAAMWLPAISDDTEFSIFDNADLQRIADSQGWLYGVLPDGGGGLQSIGTWDEQVAEFQPGPSVSDLWDGYPKWALDETGPGNRRKQQSCPERAVFNLMLAVGLINKVQHKRLSTGRHA